MKNPLSCLFLILIIVSTLSSKATSAPEYFGWREGALEKSKARLEAGDETLKPALEDLVKKADAALKQQPLSVTQKTKLPLSKDPHDYVSTAPYQWPNPDTPDGLPYIRKDGKTYPGSRDGNESDRPRIGLMSDAVMPLALGYYFTGNEKYAEHAALLLKTWFLNEDTFMKPRLKYAQAIPGLVDGRAAGILEGSPLPGVADAASLLQGSEAWTAADQKGFTLWMNSYLDWLLSDPMAVEAGEIIQNHGTSYDVQIVHLGYLLGRPELSKRVLEEVKEKRIAKQITPEGKQPYELGRTKSFHYTKKNLSHLTDLAMFGERAGIDLWHYKTEDGRSIRKALDFMVPYVKTPPEKWPFKEITNIGPSEFAPIFRKAAIGYEAPEYEKLVREMPGTENGLFQLLDPTGKDE